MAMELKLFCSRPHAKMIDFRTARFVVSKSCGLDADGVHHLEMGDAVPEGLLSEAALRQIYEPPLSRIEVLEHALKDPELLGACVQRGTIPNWTKESEPEPEPVVEPATDTMQLTQPPKPIRPPVRVGKPTLAESLETMTWVELTTLCRKNHVRHDGTKADLRQRLIASVG
jgi:hypothetical protein